MADGLPDLPGLAQAGLGLGLVVWLYVRLLMHHRQDRADARKVEAELRQSHAAELTAARQRIADLQQQLDEQRRLRWQAEDAAAKYRRQLGLPPAVDQGVDGDY